MEPSRFHVAVLDVGVQQKQHPVHDCRDVAGLRAHGVRAPLSMALRLQAACVQAHGAVALGLRCARLRIVVAVRVGLPAAGLRDLLAVAVGDVLGL